MHNPLLLQPLGHWFTFIFRKHEHLAVGSSGRGLTDSRGSALFRGRLTLAFCTLIVSYFKGFVKGFLLKFFNFFCPYLHQSMGRALAIAYSHLPLTLQIIAHLHTDFNRQNTQIREKYFFDICATFLLTNCWRYVIIEILRASLVGARLKKSVRKDDHISSRP